MYFRPGGRDEKDRYAFLFLTAYRFLEIKMSGENCLNFFRCHGINSIAICGIEEFGGFLYDDLHGTEISIHYFIDHGRSKTIGSYKGIPVLTPESRPFDIDAVIVTSVFDFNAWTDELVNAGYPLEKIISLNDILFSI